MLLKTPFKLIICGPSGCGKTQLIRDLIVNNRFDSTISELVYCYAPYTIDNSLFSDLRKESKVPCKFVEGFPAADLDNNTLFKADKSKSKLLIIDDLWDECLKTDTISKLFTCYSRHLNINVAIVCQNLYKTQSKHSITTLLRNVNYLVLFICRQNQATCRQIATNFYITEKHRILKPFEKYLHQSKSDFDYLVVDFTSRDSELSVIYMGLSVGNTRGIVFKFENEGLCANDRGSLSRTTANQDNGFPV